MLRPRQLSGLGFISGGGGRESTCHHYFHAQNSILRKIVVVRASIRPERPPADELMYAISETVPVNPAGITPVLSKSQVWQGLVMKAENALPFVPAMESCEIVERYGDGFLREIVLRGDR